MDKSDVPTSRYQLFCDTFDTKLQVEIHEIDGYDKALISIESEDGKEKKSISIYKEEVNALSKFLDCIKEYIEERP